MNPLLFIRLISDKTEQGLTSAHAKSLDQYKIFILFHHWLELQPVSKSHARKYEKANMRIQQLMKYANWQLAL
jgi:hypothetical protein